MSPYCPLGSFAFLASNTAAIHSKPGIETNFCMATLSWLIAVHPDATHHYRSKCYTSPPRNPTPMHRRPHAFANPAAVSSTTASRRTQPPPACSRGILEHLLPFYFSLQPAIAVYSSASRELGKCHLAPGSLQNCLLVNRWMCIIRENWKFTFAAIPSWVSQEISDFEDLDFGIPTPNETENILLQRDVLRSTLFTPCIDVLVQPKSHLNKFLSLFVYLNCRDISSLIRYLTNFVGQCLQNASTSKMERSGSCDIHLLS